MNATETVEKTCRNRRSYGRHTMTLTKKRYVTVPGMTDSDTDDVYGRFYLWDRDGSPVDKSGPGYSREVATGLARTLNDRNESIDEGTNDEKDQNVDD